MGGQGNTSALDIVVVGFFLPTVCPTAPCSDFSSFLWPGSADPVCTPYPVDLGPQLQDPSPWGAGCCRSHLAVLSVSWGFQIPPQEDDYGFDLEEKNKAVVVKSVQRGSLAEVRPKGCLLLRWGGALAGRASVSLEVVRTWK